MRMTRAKHACLLAAVVLLPSFRAIAASPQRPIASAVARRHGKLVFIEVKVNQAGPFWFAFDSGAHDTLIDPFVVQQAHLGLSPATSTITGTGEGEVSVRHAVPVTMRIQDLKLNITDPLVVDVSAADVPKWVHGIIGAALLEPYVVELDSERPSLRIFDSERYQPDSNAAKVPLLVENHRFFLMATLDVNDSLTVEHKLRVDTGSEDSIADDAVKNSAEVRTTTLGNGFGQSYQGQSGAFKAVHVGRFSFRHVWGPAVPNPAIGMEIFRRFTVTFDAPHHMLYLVPNQHLEEPTPAPTS